MKNGILWNIRNILTYFPDDIKLSAVPILDEFERN